MDRNPSIVHGLADALADFQQRFNTNPRVARLINGWDRVITVEATDNDERYTMIVENLKMTEVKPGMQSADYVIQCQGTAETLAQIFSGQYNPTHAILDGVFAVYCTERDKVKLEAIAMILWGL